ncbi:MAG: hypothetical protein MR437_06735 [Clostridiales bacterium]|nr:hypothetical protein [Clostridiales bacterium]MDY2900601.1 hypothetical protein [Christensenellaceae bacterium]
MNSNIVLLGLLYLLYADGYITLTQVLLLLALLSTTVYNCDNNSSTNNNNVFNN